MSRIAAWADAPSATLLQGYKQTKYGKLGAALFLDVIGMSTYPLPVIGELGDLAWGPAAAFLGHLLFKKTGWSAFTLGEEILPFTDVIPSATMTWHQTYVKNSTEARAAYCQEQAAVRGVLGSRSAGQHNPAGMTSTLWDRLRS